jgi:hypothetical protein
MKETPGIEIAMKIERIIMKIIIPEILWGV